jgi:hypothetical protein
MIRFGFERSNGLVSVEKGIYGCGFAGYRQDCKMQPIHYQTNY